MSRVAKKAAKFFKLVNTLSHTKGPEAVSARKKLKELQEHYYHKDPKPSAGMAWKPNGHKMARGKQTMRKSAPK